MAKDKKDSRDRKDGEGKASGEVPGPPAREVGKWLDLSGLRQGPEETPPVEAGPPARAFGD